MAANSHLREDFGIDEADLERTGTTRRTLVDCRIKLKIISDIKGFEELQEGWIELAEKSETHIFQTYEWNHVWWEHFGATKKLHIVAVYEGERVIGIAPLFEDDIVLLGRKVYSCLRFMGSYVTQPNGIPLYGEISYSDYLDFIIRPKHELSFYESIVAHFVTIANDFDEIILDDLSENSLTNSEIIPHLDCCQFKLQYSTEKASSCPVIYLKPTWDGFLDSLSVKDRYNARRYLNRSRYGKSMAVKIDKIVDEWELASVFTTLKEMHQIQWNSRGFAGTFSEDRMYNFFVDISKVFFEKGWIEFSLATPIVDKTKYVAVDVCMTYKNKVYLMHRGLDEDSTYRKLGPGNVLLFARINEAINDGVKVFDMLRGSEEYKLRLATNIIHTNKIVIRSNYSGGRLRAGIMKKYMKGIRLIRNERSYAIIVFRRRSFFNGLSEYLNFLRRRINKKMKWDI